MRFISSKSPLVLVLTLSLFTISKGFDLSDESRPAESRKIYNRDEVRTLSVNVPVAREMDKNQLHVYSFRGETGKCLHLAVEQKGTNVIVTLISPSQKKLHFVGRANILLGPENLTFILPEDGDYAINVSSDTWVEVKNGYSIELKPFSVPNAADVKRIEAERLVSEADGESFSGNSAKRKKSIEKFVRGIELWNELGEEYEKDVAYYGLGWAYHNESDYENASAIFGRAAENFRRSGERFMLGHCLRANAFANSRLGDFISTAVYAEESVSIFRSLGMSRYIGAGLQSLGYAQFFLEDYSSALATFKESLEHRRKSKDENGEILTLIALAKTHSKLKNYPTALEFIEQGESKAGNGNIKTKTEILVEKGWILISLKQFDEAEKSFAAALENYRAESSVSGQAIAFCGLGLIKRSRNHLKNALADIEKSLELIENLRGKLSDTNFRLSFLATNQSYYEIHINLLMELHRVYPNEGYDAKAFEASEKARARALLDLMKESAVFRQSNASPELKNRMRASQARYVSDLKDWKRISRTKNGAAAARLNLEIQAALLEKREIEVEFKNKFTGKSELQDFRTLSAEDVKSLLDDETVLLEFGLYRNDYGGENSYVWAVSKDRIDGFALAPRGVIEEKVGRAYQLLTVRNNLSADLSPDEKQSTINDAENEYRRISGELTGLLFDPLVKNDLLASKKRLLIVSNGILQSLPFASLPDPLDKTGSNYLVGDFEIVNLPSAAVLGALRERRRTRSAPEKTAFVLADPVFSENDERFDAANIKSKSAPPKNRSNHRSVLRLTDYFAQNDLPRLFNTRFEAEKISSFLSADQKKIELDFGASVGSVTKKDLARYRILHFATHALIDDETPDLSGIALSMFDEKRRPVEGFLLSGDIFQLKLNADLVVLSGCRTGLGKPVRGEGYVGLTQSFMYAGASRLLTSLWSVEDRATAELMTYFYKYHLEKKMPAAAALKEAQKEMSKSPRWKSPYFWASFTLQGEFQ